MEYLGLVDTDDEEEYEGEQSVRERSRHYETTGSSRYETPRAEPTSRREPAARSPRYAPSPHRRPGHGQRIRIRRNAAPGKRSAATIEVGRTAVASHVRAGVRRG